MSNNQIATTGGGIIGGVIGAYYGQPGLGFAVGSAIGGALVPPQIADQVGGQLDDLTISSSAYGRPIPLLWGSNRVSGTLIFSSGKKETKVETDISGKGGPEQAAITYTYSMDAAYSLGALPPSASEMQVRKIWINSQLVYDISNETNAINLEKSTELAAAVTVYDGGETQLPSSLQESYKGVGNVPAYRGQGILEFEDLQLGQFGNGTVTISAEVVVDPPASTAPFSINGWAGISNPLSAKYDNGTIITAHAENFTPTSVDTWDHVVRRYDLEGNLLSEQRKTINVGLFPSGTPAARFTYNDPMMVASDGGSPEKFRLSKFDAVEANGNAWNQNHPYDQTWNENAWGADNQKFAWVKWGEYFYVIGGSYGAGAGSRGYPPYLGRFPISADITNPKVGYPAQDADLSVNISNIYGTQNFKLSLDVKLNRLYLIAATGGGIWSITSWDDELNLLHIWQEPTATIPRDMKTGLSMFSGNKILTKDEVGTTNQVHLFEFDQETDNSTLTLVGSKNLTGSAAFDDIYPLTENLALAQKDIVSIEPLISQAAVSLADIIGDMLTLVGADPADYDTSGLTDTVAGYQASRLASARRSIEPIMSAYFIDAVEVDNTIKFVKRGGASIKTISDDEIIRVDNTLLQRIRGSELELMKRVVFSYIDPASDYQTNTQHADRLVTVGATGISNVAVGAVIEKDDAAQIADAMLYSSWIERERITAYVSTMNMDLVPTDVITIGSAGIRMRIKETSTKLVGAIKLQGVQDYAQSYVSGRAGGSATAQSSMAGLYGPTVLQMLDIPILRDLDEGIIKYAGFSGVLPGWGGALLYKSTDSGKTWTERGQGLTSTIYGFATSALADGKTSTWDYVNTININIANGALESKTEIEVLNGSNAAAIGDDGRWEIIQWQTATFVSGTTYQLSGLLRGRRGTEHNTGNHVDSDRFVVLSEQALIRLNDVAADVDQTYLYKGVSIGSTVQATSAELFTNTAVCAMPFSPTQIKGSRDGSNNLTTTFKRRDRLGYRANYTLPLSEDSQSYEIEYWDTADTAQYGTFKTATGQTHSYTAAQQTTDGATPGQAFLVKIYQISALVGRGYEGAEII